jgi:hypothetical protein
MTSRREDEEEDETGRKETSSSQGGRKEEERGQTATTRVAKIVEIVGTSTRAGRMLHWSQSKKQEKQFVEYVGSR